MHNLIQRLRDACARGAALAKLVLQAEPEDLEELKENARCVEQECLDLIEEVDSAEDN